MNQAHINPDTLRRPAALEGESAGYSRRETVPVSVVIVNCNGGTDVRECIEALTYSDPSPIEVILVDNGSTDGSEQLLRPAGASFEFRTLRLKQNFGPAAARNVGASAATCEVFAFLDNDTKVSPGWLQGALEAMRLFKAECIQCKLVLDHDRSRLDSIGYLFGPFGFPRHLVRPGASDSAEFQFPTRVFGVKSAGMVITRAIFERVGGFDPSFFIYGEETDMCWRIMRSGATVFFAPESVVFHKSGGTRRLLPGQASGLLYRGGTRNYIRMVAKNTAYPRVIFDVAGQVTVWTLVGTLQIVRGRLQIGTLIWRGVRDAIAELPRVMRERRVSPLPYVRAPKVLRARFGLSYLRKVLRAV
jgi:GT2 family glycosyltransferase